MTDSATGTEQLVGDYDKEWNEGDYSKIPELVSESFVLYDPTNPEGVAPGSEEEAHGAEGLESFLEWLRAGFPDFHVTIIELLTSENVAMDEVKFTGTNTGGLDGVPPIGRRVEMLQ